MKYWDLENSWKPINMGFTYFMFDDVDFETHQNPFVFMDFNVCMFQTGNWELQLQLWLKQKQGSILKVLNILIGDTTWRKQKKKKL